MDKLTPQQRSERMRKIRSIDTKPEIIVRKFLHSNGLRYVLHDKKLFGKPDLKLTKFKTLIFVNGCFWHGHADCKNNKIPKSNNFYWKTKIEKNTLRDKEVFKTLKKQGWKIIVLWECQLSKLNRVKTLSLLLSRIVK